MFEFSYKRTFGNFILFAVIGILLTTPNMSFNNFKILMISDCKAQFQLDTT